MKFWMLCWSDGWPKPDDERSRWHPVDNNGRTGGVDVAERGYLPRDTSVFFDVNEGLEVLEKEVTHENVALVLFDTETDEYRPVANNYTRVGEVELV